MFPICDNMKVHIIVVKCKRSSSVKKIRPSSVDKIFDSAAPHVSLAIQPSLNPYVHAFLVYHFPTCLM